MCLKLLYNHCRVGLMVGWLLGVIDDTKVFPLFSSFSLRLLNILMVMSTMSFRVGWSVIMSVRVIGSF